MQWKVVGQEYTSDQTNIVLAIEFRVNSTDVDPLWSNTYSFLITSQPADVKAYLDNQALLLKARYNKVQSIPNLIGQNNVV